MNIQVNVKHGDEALSEFHLEGLAYFVLEQEKLPVTTEVSISFVSNQEIAELNELYRKKKGPTDVLSFECDELDDEMSGVRDELEVFVLGDVVIAADIARQQAYEYETSFQEEIELLCVHGLLHLCGYDHGEDIEAEEMEAREAETLRLWRRR